MKYFLTALIAAELPFRLMVLLISFRLAVTMVTSTSLADFKSLNTSVLQDLRAVPIPLMEPLPTAEEFFFQVP